MQGVTLGTDELPQAARCEGEDLASWTKSAYKFANPNEFILFLVW
jgi:hypothetical protein